MVDAHWMFSLLVMGITFASASELVATKPAKAAEKTPASCALVDLDFSEPTSIQDVTKFLSAKLGVNFVLPPNAIEKIQILAPQPLTCQDAFDAYVGAVEMVGYRVSQAGKVIKLQKVQSN